MPLAPPVRRVGVRDLRYPIVILDRGQGTQHTIADVTMSVELPHHYKGTHMSRFVEILNAHRGEITMRTMPQILRDLRTRLRVAVAVLLAERERAVADRLDIPIINKPVKPAVVLARGTAPDPARAAGARGMCPVCAMVLARHVFIFLWIRITGPPGQYDKGRLLWRDSVLMVGLLRRSKLVCAQARKSLKSALSPLIVSHSWTIKPSWMPFTPGDG